MTANLGTQATSVIWPKSVNQIPKEVMVRRDLYELEREKIFLGPHWHPVAHESELPNAGDFKTFALAEVPVLITRDDQGALHVLYNSCSHRGTLVAQAFRGNSPNFECPYHRWVFSIDGSLKSCPKKGEGYAPGFRREDFPLQKVRFALFKGLIFITFSNETPPLDLYLGEVAPTIDNILHGDGRLELIGYQKVMYQANWKGYNDSDGYHAPLLHGAFRLLNWQGGKGSQTVSSMCGHIGTTSQISLPADGGRSMLRDPSIIEFRDGDPTAGSYVVKMFPIFVGVRHLDVINLRFATPAGVDRTEVHYAYFAHADDTADMRQHRVRQASNLLGPSGLVSLEDAAAFQRIHIGCSSPGVATFQKGVTSHDAFPETYVQNEESSNLPKWDFYRRVMGFEREEA
jgi:anthranilate 1,2-dioxygenase large subunit